MGIEQSYLEVMEKIEAACLRSGRSPDEITLVAVSKKQQIERIQELLEITQRLSHTLILGENYVQEFKLKRLALPGVETHLIGPLQRNKVRDALKLFDVIESVHNEELLLALQKEATQQNRSLSIYLQVNISSDDNKAGFEPEALMSLLAKWSYSNLELKGLMTITRYFEVAEEVRPFYRAMRELRESIMTKFPQLWTQCPCRLSMGMSHDFQVAIEEGADLVRVGTALFGERI